MFSGPDLIGAGASMVTHGNSIYVFGGMNEERAEHMAMWRWDLGCDDGFVEVAYRLLSHLYPLMMGGLPQIHVRVCFFCVFGEGGGRSHRLNMDSAHPFGKFHWLTSYCLLFQGTNAAQAGRGALRCSLRGRALGVSWTAQPQYAAGVLL